MFRKKQVEYKELVNLIIEAAKNSDKGITINVFINADSQGGGAKTTVILGDA